jgi:lipopolysaccharide/colanic/teichoic acid biosynthesis glycosyltransferase
MIPGIHAVEIEQTKAHQEGFRRIRIGAGNVQQLFRLAHLFNPRYGAVAWMFLSGKALRIFMPFCLLIALLANVILATQSIVFASAATLQGLTLGLALAAYASWGNNRWAKALRYFYRGHLYSGIGASRYIWDRIRGAQSKVIFHKSASDAWDAPDKTIAIAKRIFDLVAATFALVLLSPLFPLVALAIKLNSKGPIIFKQMRIGLCTHDRTTFFMLYKFRSMVQDAEAATGAVLATRCDARITSVGRFLRKSRLDELPQLWNVIRGDMSLVGPRPERPDFYNRLEVAIPYFAERTYGVLPGITGLAQVNQGYDTCVEDVRSKVGYDHSYALCLHNPWHWLRMDLWILGKTVGVMITGRGQ